MGFGRVQGQSHINCVLSCFQFFCARRITAIISLSRNLLAPETRYVCACVLREGVICAQLVPKNDTGVEFSHTHAHIRAFYTRTYSQMVTQIVHGFVSIFTFSSKNKDVAPRPSSPTSCDMLIFFVLAFPAPLSVVSLTSLAFYHLQFEKSWSLQGDQHPLLPLHPEATVLCVLN